MIDKLLESFLQFNLITLLILCVVAVSALLGYTRGASASARHLFQFIAYGVITLAALFTAWRLADWFSPLLHTWLTGRNIVIPPEHLGLIRQTWYTFITGLRDFSLLRFSCVFVVVYFTVRSLFSTVLYRLSGHIGRIRDGRGRRTIGSGMIGVGIGSMLGAARALIVIFALFVYATLQPQSSLSYYAQDSILYQQGASQIIAPLSGQFIAERLPVFTRAVEQEFRSILQRKYEIVDQHIPSDIAAAAAEITRNGQTDEDMARALYEWIGTRIKYNNEKVRLYEEENVWLEQTPEDTFRTRSGVCIDYSRLYAVMARSVQLQVKVITGLGYDGRSGYGPHAWNEVYLSERNMWAKLDSTWVSSGGNWFNPPNFDETHIKDA